MQFRNAMNFRGFGPVLMLCLVLAACATREQSVAPPAPADDKKREAPRPNFNPAEPGETPEKVLGEKLFRDPRFAFHFAKDSRGNVNVAQNSLPGDPVLAQIVKGSGTVVSSPFRGQYFACITCHLVGQASGISGLGSRSYSDFSRRSPVPIRDDGQKFTLRNSQPMVNIMIPRKAALTLHFDGEFSSAEELTIGSLTGRNFGWLPGEQSQAKAQIVKVLREDLGADPLGIEFGGSYAAMFGDESRLPKKLKMDVASASDQEILDKVAKVMSVYMNTLLFIKDDEDLYSGSPYDQFLIQNGLPRSPDPGESDLDYSLRLAKRMKALVSPKWYQGQFRLHETPAKFGEDELKGFLTFMAPNGGHCLGCHAAPHFTDFGFRNTGVTQFEYDSVHGEGAFASLEIPGAEKRATFLPEDFQQFRSIPQKDRSTFVDLGVWAILGNPSFPKVQATLESVLCPSQKCLMVDLLGLSLAAFKTPTLRDLGQSGPYFHNGMAQTLDETVQFYSDAGTLVRSNRLRNGDARLRPIHLSKEDVRQVALFLQSLNEDYDD